MEAMGAQGWGNIQKFGNFVEALVQLESIWIKLDEGLLTCSRICIPLILVPILGLLLVSLCLSMLILTLLLISMIALLSAYTCTTIAISINIAINMNICILIL